MMVAYNYLRQGKNVLILTPSQDTRRDSLNEISSRAIAEPLSCVALCNQTNIIEYVYAMITVPHAILVDEAQFFTKEQIRQLAILADERDIPILCYGLRCSYVDGELFEGSAALMYWADSIEEIKTVCEYCDRKATKNLLRINGVPQYSGNAVVIGDIIGDTMFTPTCRKHYLNPPKEG